MRHPARFTAGNTAPINVAISCVRNEEDIIEAFVRHTAALVDQLVVLDNGSTDGTREILAALINEGLPLVVRDDGVPGHWQSQRMTALMREAAQNRSVRWILPLDADEFLPANLNAILSQRPARSPSPMPLRIPWQSYAPDRSDDCNDPNPATRIRHRLASELGVLTKVVVPAELARVSGMRLAQGNHQLERGTEPIAPELICESVFLAHFPIRSVEQYAAKTLVGWLQFLAMSERGEEWGFHRKLSYERLKADPARFSIGLREEALSYGLKFREGPDAKTVCDPIPYLGGALRYTSKVTADSYALRQLICYAEELALHHALLTSPRRNSKIALASSLIRARLRSCLSHRGEILQALARRLSFRLRPN